jgi:hypothetical protein
MAANDSLDSRQTDSCPRKTIVVMHALERPKELASVLHIKASSVVPDEESTVPILLFRSQLDRAGGGLACKFPGVTESCRRRFGL